MIYVKKKFIGRKSLRVKGYDYSSNGAYFITIIVKERKEVLGQIVNGKVVHTDIGKIAYKNWLEIPNHFNNIEIDEFIVMPNHIHGILKIEKGEKGKLNSVGTQYIDSTDEKINRFQHIVPGSISTVIRSYKASVTREVNRKNYNFKWQRGFYDRILRNEKELQKSREYIINNPLKWELDKNNPKSPKHIKGGTIY